MSAERRVLSQVVRVALALWYLFMWLSDWGQMVLATVGVLRGLALVWLGVAVVAVVLRIRGRIALARSVALTGFGVFVVLSWLLKLLIGGPID